MLSGHFSSACFGKIVQLTIKDEELLSLCESDGK